jgi:hypothetical protein
MFRTIYQAYLTNYNLYMRKASPIKFSLCGSRAEGGRGRNNYYYFLFIFSIKVRVALHTAKNGCFVNMYLCNEFSLHEYIVTIKGTVSFLASGSFPTREHT